MEQKKKLPRLSRHSFLLRERDDMILQNSSLTMLKENVSFFLRVLRPRVMIILLTREYWIDVLFAVSTGFSKMID